MAFEPDFETIAGTRLRIAPGKPTDDTAAAFATLFGGAAAAEFELTNVGGVEGRAYETSTLTVVSSRRNRMKPGTYSYPSGEFAIVWLPESDAHIIAEEAMTGGDIASFELTRQSGQVVYYIGYVMNLSESGGGPNDALTGTLTIQRDSEIRKPVTP